MVKSMYLAGIGGQGLQMVGKAIAETANEKGLYVTYSPKYGTAKRGGLTSCFVVISDAPIGNPRRKLQDLILVMEPMAYRQFCHDAKSGGTLIVNSTLVPGIEAADAGVRLINVPLHSVCAQLGNTKVISSVALGALSEALRDLFPDPEDLLRLMLRKLEGKPELVSLNERAFAAGRDVMQVS